MRVRWNPARMSQLEAAVSRHHRVVLHRRGTEYVVVAQALRSRGREEILVGRLPVTGEDLEFVLGELESFLVLEQ